MRFGLREELFQLDGCLGLELGQGARLRRLVGPPALKADAVTEATVLQTIERDFAHEFRAQRFPGEVAVLRPATRSARRPPALKTGPATQRLEHCDQVASLRVVESRGVANELEGLAAIDAEQERPDTLAVVAPAKPTDDNVRRALLLDLDHGALARFVDALDALGHDAVEPGSAVFLQPADRDVAIAGRGAQVDRRRLRAEQFLEPLAPFS